MNRSVKPRDHDPRRLDVATFAAGGTSISGRWKLPEMSRLAESESPPVDTPGAEIDWNARGERIDAVGRPTQTWLHLHAATTAWLTCQRCLQPMPVALNISPSIRFVADEAEAERLDAESEHDVLALSRSLDLRELLEDELLLALPPVPRHEHCPQPLAADPSEAVPDAVERPAPHPFAALAALKRPPKG